MDDLLAQLQSLQPDAPNSAPPSPPLPPAGSLDSLLDSLDDRPKRSLSQPAALPSANPRFDALVKPPLPPILPVAQPSQRTAPADSLLADIKAIYQEQDQATALKQRAELEAERRRQETLKLQRRGQVVKQAETWLKDLNAQSGEAAWFEEFAAKYSSRVEAAIDYLNLDP